MLRLGYNRAKFQNFAITIREICKKHRNGIRLYSVILRKTTAEF